MDKWEIQIMCINNMITCLYLNIVEHAHSIFFNMFYFENVYFHITMQSESIWTYITSNVY